MSRSVRFYLDEHVGTVVRQALRQRGIDVETVAEADLLGAPDATHLEHARLSRRVLVSRDSDFLVFHAEGRPHAGIAYASQQVSPRRLLDGLLLIHAVLGADEMTGAVEFL